MNGLNNLRSIFLFISFLGATARAQSYAYPNPSWETRKPEDVGVDSIKLKEAFSKLSKSINTSRTVVVRKGYLIHQGSSSKSKARIYSATKSFTSTVLGLLVDDGKITLDSEAWKSASALKSQYSKVTLKHFATMTSGYDAKGGSYADGGKDGSSTPFSPDKALFSAGSQFAYWDDAIHMYSLVLTNIAKKSMSALFNERIATKIGLSGWSWATIGKSGSIPVNGGAGDMNLSAYEAAKFGHLFLSKGTWRGQQLISESWVKQATSVQVPKEFPQSKYRTNYAGTGQYGFNWWVNGVKPNGSRKWPSAPVNTFAAVGAFSNLIIVVPEWHMVIVRLWDGNKKAAGDSKLDEFFATLKASIK